MLRRIFICTTVKFPRGGAGANYIEYLALALKQVGYDVYILGINNKAKEQEQEYQGLQFVPFAYGKSKGKKIFDYYFLGKRVVMYLADKGLGKNDYVIFYTKNPFYMTSILSLMKKVNCTGGTCVVEWHQAFQYKWNGLNLEYRFYRRCFDKYYLETGNIIAISELLQKEYTKRGCNAICIPIMANTKDYEYIRSEHELKEILISGMEDKKDDPYVMLHSFGQLTEEELMHIHINITGTSQKNFEKYADGIDENVKSRVTVHDWMNYEELIELYHTVDFLLIARRDNIVTQANFPSKVPEGLTFGIVPIVTRVGDYTSKYLDSTNSIIFENCTCEECATALKKAIGMSDDEYRVLSNNARKLAEEKFDYENWTPILEAFIEEGICSNSKCLERE